MKKSVIKIIIYISCGLFLVSGCAKKEIKVVPPQGSQGSALSNSSASTIKQEDLTRSGGEIGGEGIGQAKVGEYNLSQPEELQGEGTKVKETVISSEDKKILHQRIHFAFDSYELSPKARAILKKKAEVLLKYPNIKMVIEGHCDERGTEEYNLALGERRARAAYEYLILLGIDADRLSIVSYGEERPLDPRHNEEAWAKNRRDEFRIVK